MLIAYLFRIIMKFRIHLFIIFLLFMFFSFKFKMKVPKKKLTRFMNGAFVIALLVHICSSCSSKAQGFTFKDDEPKSLSDSSIQKEPVAAASKLEPISADNYFDVTDNIEAPVINEREGKEIERIDLEETVEDEPPRFPRKISVSSKTEEEEIGKLFSDF